MQTVKPKRDGSTSRIDTLGRVVAVLADGVHEAGVHEATFDASHLPSGMYFTRLDSGGQSLLHRMLLVK